MEGSPISRLYAGALLGKSLIKELGQIDAEGGQRSLAARRATLLAGVASGKIKGSQLGGVDPTLLAEATKQHISSSPFGFVGGFFKNLAKGAGEFGESLTHLPEGIYQTGKAFGEEAQKTVLGDQGNKKAPFMEELGLIGKSVAHDFSSPRQIYEHPFNPLLDVGAAFTGGAGVATKVAGGLARGAEAAGTEAGPITKALVKVGSIERAPAIASPGFTEANADELAANGVFSANMPRAFSPRLGMKYGIQKPLDTLLESRVGKLKLGRGGETLRESQGRYYANKLINTRHAQVSSGTQEALLASPIDDFKKSAVQLYKDGSQYSQGKGLYQSQAAWFNMVLGQGKQALHRLDEYAGRLREGLDHEGPIYTAEELSHAQDVIKHIEDPAFRNLVEKPTSDMRNYAYQLRRLNVHIANHLDIDPLTSEDAAFGRLRELTGLTTEEVRSQLPASMQPQSELGRGLQWYQEHIGGVKPGYVLGAEPDLKLLSHSVPGVKPEIMRDILERAIASFRQDIEHNVSLAEKAKDPNYLSGRNIYQKVATALHDEAGISEEQAQAFARGISLGDASSAIMPTYVPSISGEGFHYGIVKDPLKTRVGRVLGVSKFRPINEEIGRQAQYYEVPKPFTPRRASAQTIGLGPARNYLREANYDSFVKGAMNTNPDVLLRNAFQIYRDISAKVNPEMLEKLAAKDADQAPLWLRGPGEMQEKLGLAANQHTFVPVDTWRRYIANKGGLEQGMAELLREAKANNSEADLEQQIENLADESAHDLVSGAIDEAAGIAHMGNHVGLAIPTNYVNQILKHIYVSEEGGFGAKVNAMLIGRWKSAVLSFMPSWLMRTVIGHGILAVIDGTVNPKYWVMAHRYFEDRPIDEGAREAVAWGKQYGDDQLNVYSPKIPAGIAQGGMQHELTDVGQGARENNQFIVAKGISHGVHVGTNYQRRAIFLRNLDKAAKQTLAELEKDFEHPGGFWNSKNIDAVLDPRWRAEVMKQPDLVEHVFDQVGHVSYTFGLMSPWERRLIKNVIPFYGWYKFITKFIWGMPINYPGRSAALAAIGNIGTEDVNKLGVIPDYLQSAIFFNHDDLSKAKYLNLYGLNPLQDPANPFSAKGPLMGDLRAGQLSPLIQTILQSAGINPLNLQSVGIDPNYGIEQGKYGEWINTNTGKEVGSLAEVNPIQRAVGSFLRAFPEIRMSEEFNTGGNPVYPESIPFISEHPIGVNPQTRRNQTPGKLLLQWMGLQPRSYDILKHTANITKQIEEARQRNIRSKARQATRLSE